MRAPEALVLDLLSALSDGPRTLSARSWRLGGRTCPRLPVWEDAVDQGLVKRRGNAVELTEAGRQKLRGDA